MATIKDIAEFTGVSLATVSYALNGKSNVSRQTSEKILKAAKELNYTPPRGNNSSGKKVKSLAFVSCLPFDPWGDTYWGEFLKGCLDASHEVNSILQIARIDPERPFEDQLPVLLREGMADGLIITGWPNEALIEKLSEKNTPTVLLDTHKVYEGFHHVRPDHFGGIHKAVNHLHSLGHRRIASIGGSSEFACERIRYNAYKQAMEELGLKHEDSWIIEHPALCEDAGRAGIKTLVDNKIDVTAILCHGDLIAREAITTIQEYGFTVPEDFSVIGIDNQPFSKTTNPPLSTIDVSLNELGQTAVTHLMEIINKPMMSPRHITIESRLIIRESTSRQKKCK